MRACLLTLALLSPVVVSLAPAGAAASDSTPVLVYGDSNGKLATLEVETPDEPILEQGPEGASHDRVAAIVQRRERRILATEAGALLLEVLLVLLLVAAVGYLLVQVAAMV